MNATATRHAALEDINAVLPLFESYRAFYGEASRTAAARTFLRDRWILGESKLIVAETAGEIVGFTQLFPSFSSVTLQRLWILNDLFVTEHARGQGIGRQLLQAAAHFGQTTLAKQLFIEGGVANTKARRLYEDFGFVPNHDYMYYHLPL
jgi:GNAT superfamily N-acetyltransferase